ncbi:MAG: hypothetical protein FJ090_14675 [Deltaproteobacteria bacterium]|nr:hypothetical protein [Deltaproteobacteria bacterium]
MFSLLVVSLLVGSAWAIPDHEVAAFGTSSPVERVVSSPEGGWIAWTTADGQVVALDTTTWSEWAVDLEGGGSAAGAIALGGAPGSTYLAVATADDAVEIYALSIDGGVVHQRTVNAADGVLDLAIDSEKLFIVADSSGYPSVIGYGVSTGTLDSESASLNYGGFVSVGARVSSTASGDSGDSASDPVTTASYLYVLHPDGYLSQVNAASYVDTSSTYAGGDDLVDMWVDSADAIWMADGAADNGSFAYVIGDASELEIYWASADIGAVSQVTGSNTGGYLAGAASDGVHLFSVIDGVQLGEEVARVDLAGVTDMTGAEGHLFAGGDDGVRVLSDRPWVEILSLSADSGAPGEELAAEFTSDTEGAWTASLMDANGGGGDEVAGGEMNAGETVEFSFTLPEEREGESDNVVYRLEVSVDPPSEAPSGRDATFVVRDAAPDRVVLGSDNVIPGDQRITVTFPGVDEGEATSYIVYLTTVEFAARDYPVGGPAYEGPDAWLATRTMPLEDTADEYTNAVVCSLDPLTNDTTYYVAVRAIDASTGTPQEGPMSKVVPVTPSETYAVSEVRGLAGWCGLPLLNAGWLGVVAAVLAVWRRRPAAAALALLVLPAAAEAKPHEDDLTSRRFDLELRYGPFLTQEDALLADAFGGENNRLLRGDIGWASNYAELDIGFGLWADEGTLVSIDGLSSADADALTVIPLSFDATLRGDFWKEQPVVPFARAGVDLWLWNERWEAKYDEGGGDSVTAGTFGYHWAAGLYLLLDPLDQGSASHLETIASVNDTYLVAEYRRSYALGDKDEIIDFTSSDLTFGLKFDY